MNMHAKVQALIFVLSIAILGTASAQHKLSAEDQASIDKARNAALAKYSATIGDQQGIQNGRTPKRYYYPFEEGSPYYDTTGYIEGYVKYDGMPYTGVGLQFDNMSNELNVELPSGRLQLNSPLIDSFSFNGLQFKRFGPADTTAGFKTGFYEVLHNNKTMLLEKTIKMVIEKPDLDTKIHRIIDTKYTYWVKHKGIFYQVQNKNDVLQIFADQKPELEKFIRKNRIKFKKQKKDNMIETITYYDQLNP